MAVMGEMMPVNYVLVSGANQSNARNLALAPLIMDLLKTPGKLDDRLLCVALYTIAMVLANRNDVALRFLELGLFEYLVELLREDANPVAWVSACSVSGPRCCGQALHTMKDLVETCQAAGVDLTPRLLSSGYMDLLIDALKAVERVGSDKAHPIVVVCTSKSIPPLLVIPLF